MAVDLEDEILQDFLVEAGEILELLNEQLVMLEQSPDDIELLNAIFRGFHTIKGGAGFLAFNALVTVCHKAEDVFDVLREGKRKVSVDLMDVILDVVDVVNLMFDQVKSGMDPEDAEDNLMMRLQGYTRAGDTVAVDAPVIADVVGQEVESMLGDSFADDKTQVNDEITESEFDQLLDELHGQGQFSAKKLQQQDE
nr:chemotaxis protein CheA [Rhodospirillales bacterium]